MTSKFTPAISKQLKYYVYIYSHPVTEEVFYVGKGKGNRVFSHLVDVSENEKVQYITQLRSQNLEPKVEILVHGIDDEKTALNIEASIIDLLGMENLTNKQSGYKSKSFGRMTIEQVRATYQKEKVDIIEPSLLIRINQAFRYSMTPMELYDYTRGQWKLKLENAQKVKFAFAVYQGVIQEVYEVLHWFPANSTLNTRENNRYLSREAEEGVEGRYEFVGNMAPNEIREKYVYKSVDHYYKKGMSNPILYLNV